MCVRLHEFSERTRLCAGSQFARWQIYKARHGDTAAAAFLTTVLVDLGPAFVKIGQAISSRPDIVPPHYLKELESLQDDIPPFSNKAAMDTIAVDLGSPAGKLFRDLSTNPVAAASLGQVYKGRIAATGALFCSIISLCCSCHATCS